MARKKKSDVEADKLWVEFKKRPTEELRNLLILKYLPIVKYTAERLGAKLPDIVDVEDLKSYGIFGLMQAIEGFDLSRGIKFETYCTTRIYGAILDELRSLDWVPRQVRAKSHKLDRAITSLAQALGREPEDEEIAKHLNLSMEEYDEYVRETNATAIIPLEGDRQNEHDENKKIRTISNIEDKRGFSPSKNMQRRELKELITRGLSKKEKLIILLYYYEELTMKEIGLTLEMSESRVCQIHSRLLARLRAHLNERRHEFAD